MVILPIFMSDPFGAFKLLLLILLKKRCHQINGQPGPPKSTACNTLLVFKPMAAMLCAAQNESNAVIIIVNKTNDRWWGPSY